jgi:conjugal transfer pilus assembly protein TraF
MCLAMQKNYGKLPNWFALLIFAATMLQILVIFSSYAMPEPQKLEGFNWYNEKKEELRQKENERLEKTMQENLSDVVLKEKPEELPEYEKNIRSLQKRHKEAHRQALDNPTTENLLRELRIEREMMDKSKQYAERRVVIAMLDSKLHDMSEHSNVLHRRVQDGVEEKEIAEKLSFLSKDWGLVLQIEQDCHHCHAFAPIVLEFAEAFGFQLIAASKDGSDFNGIEGVRDMGKMLVFNPERLTPMLYLVKGDGKEVFPISRGINNQAQIIENIKAIDKHLRRLF